MTLPAISFSDPAQLDLTAYRGDSGRIRVTVTDPGGAPVDVTGATWDCDVRVKADDTGVVFSFDVEPVAGETSQVDVVLTTENAALLPPTAVWDLQMTLAGETVTLLTGKVSTTSDVSRP